MCEEEQIVPCSYFLAHIEDEKLLLRYHQFNTDDIRAITKTLTVSSKSLSFQFDNPSH